MCSDAASELTPRTLIVGLGNPILGDDGVGWRVADELEAELAVNPALRAELGPLEIDRLSVGGLRLMERMVGYERVVLIDSTFDGRAPGTVALGTLTEVDGRLAGHLDSAHDASLSTALDVGAALGARLPESLTVVTISALYSADFDDALTPAVAAAVPTAVAEIIHLLRLAAEVPAEVLA